MKINVQNFMVPERYVVSYCDFFSTRVSVIIPTYKPGGLTARLVENLVRWNPNILVYVVDDCTPASYDEGEAIFKRIASVSSERVEVLRTPVNRLKAGALNYALKHLLSMPQEVRPNIIMTLDDDVVINRKTLKNMLLELLKYKRLGAVCSQCLVYNKNKNVLTRLQSLEYQGFNATRLADEGFYGGPLVMHGMLTAFKTEALEDVGGFIEGHLIEDYEITTRLKIHGWHVKSVVNAVAWTIVPETLAELWRQRTRWSYGGMMVMTKSKRFEAVLQDIIGHGVFIATVVLIGLLLLSQEGTLPSSVVYPILFVSFFQLVLWYAFQLWLMRLYKEKDAYDWLMRASLLPEFIYCNIHTLVLVGSYLFFTFNMLTGSITEESHTVLKRIHTLGKKLFSDFGYTEGWGTRTS